MVCAYRCVWGRVWRYGYGGRYNNYTPSFNFLSISQKFAQGYNLYAFLIMAVVALIIHNKNKLVHFKDIILIVISGTLFCIGGSFLTTVVKTDILKIIFAGFLILLSIFEFVKIFKKS